MSAVRFVLSRVAATARRPVGIRVPRLVCFTPVLVFVLIRAVVYATPADPLWIPGLYDGADFDDTIAPFRLVVGTADDGPIQATEPLRPSPESVSSLDSAGIPLTALPAVHSRAPPVS